MLISLWPTLHGHMNAGVFICDFPRSLCLVNSLGCRDHGTSATNFTNIIIQERVLLLSST